MNRLLVDFNEIKKGVVGGLIEDCDYEPQVGDIIIIYDGPGEDYCEGEVLDITNAVVHVQMDWNTWNNVHSE